jgi:outer membrane protein X
MSKIKFCSILLLLSSSATPVHANNSVSLNYAIGKESGAESMHGVNVMIKHNINDFAFLVSGTYVQNITDNDSGYFKNKYASLMPGVSYNLSKDLCFYGLAGLSAGSKVKDSQTHEIYGVAFGSGILYTLTDNIQFNAGYELGIVDAREINTFIVGLGYMF